MDAYTLIGRVDDEGFERMHAHDKMRYVARTAGSFSAFVAYEVADVDELGRVVRELDQLGHGRMQTHVSVTPSTTMSAKPEIPPHCVDVRTLTIDWECVGYDPPMPSHEPVKQPYTAFAVCRTRAGLAGDGDAALRRAPGVRAFCELADPGSWLAELGTEDADDLLWAVDQLVRGDVFSAVRSGVVVRGRRERVSAG